MNSKFEEFENASNFLYIRKSDPNVTITNYEQYLTKTKI